MNIVTTTRNALDPVFELFPYRVHPDVVSVESAVRRWFRDTELVESAELDRFDRSGFGRVAAQMFPLTTDPRPFGKLFAWITVVDDMLDTDPQGTSTRSPDAVIEELLALFESGESPDRWRGGVVPSALGNVWPDLTTGMDDSWCDRLRGHLADIVHNGRRWADSRAAGRPPALADYVGERRRDGVYLAALDQIERASGRHIANAVYHSAEFGWLLDALMDVAIWSDDLGSAERELGGGEVMNLVAVLQAETGSLPAAVDRAIELLARRTRQFHDATSNPRVRHADDGPDRAQLDSWVEDARLLIRGCYEWFMSTPRYETPGRERVLLDIPGL